jgi:hypothetical protein
VTQFEFVAIVVSIILGLSIARLLESLRDCFDAARRYWIHAVWVVGKFMNTLVIFWSGWVLRNEIETFNFAQFTTSLGPPAIIFLQVHTLVTADPQQVTDWRSHFWRVRRWFFGANAILPLYNMLYLYVLARREFPSPEAVPLTVVFLLSLTGIISSSERLHGAIAILYLITMVLGFGSLFVPPR